MRKREGIAGFGGFPLVLLQNLSAARVKAPLSAFASGNEQRANQKPAYQKTNGGRGIPLNGQRDKRRKRKLLPRVSRRPSVSAPFGPAQATGLSPGNDPSIYGIWNTAPKRPPSKQPRACHDPRKARPRRDSPAYSWLPFLCVQGFAGGIVLPRAACRLCSVP